MGRDSSATSLLVSLRKEEMLGMVGPKTSMALGDALEAAEARNRKFLTIF
jgi:hypothetical protein